MTVPVKFTVNIPVEALKEAKDEQEDQGLRERAISQTVMSFAITCSFALIHVAIGALRVDLVEKAKPMSAMRTQAEHDLRQRGIEELVPGVVGALLSFLVFIPLINAVQTAGSSKKVHLLSLGVSFAMNFLWCLWFAIMCGVYSNEDGAEVDALNLILAIINFIVMIFNLMSSKGWVLKVKSKELEAEAD